MKPILLRFAAFLLGIASVGNLSAQTFFQSGTVIDAESNEPLIGVNILTEPGGTGTVTDYDGTYTLEVREGDVLVFSYTGYENTRRNAVRDEVINVRLQPNSELLKEVVVVGYGSQKRSDLTGALSSVSEEEIKALPVTGLDQALQGRAAGVLVTQNSGAPGGAVSVRVRGIGSTLTAEPLYVIDGVPVVNDNAGTSSNLSELDGGGQNSNALNTINPNDIQSIEVLKDASATAIYGARGANGVVLITTKRGESGQSRINFDTYVGVQELSKKIPVMNLVEYADYVTERGNSTPIEEFERPELLGEGTDWQDAVFQTALQQNYQLNLSGGSDKTTFAIGGGYNYKEGIVIGSDFTRISGKLNLDHKINDRIRVGNSLLLSRTNENITFNDNSSGVIYTALLMVPNAPVYNVDGTFAAPQEEIILQFDNPVARALDTDDQNFKTRFLSNLYAEIDLLEGLRYRTEFGSDILYSNQNTFLPSFDRGNFSGKSGVRRSVNNSFFWINKHLLTYTKQLTPRHKIDGLLGFEAQEGNYEWLYASRENLPTNDLQQINLGDAGQAQNGGGAGHFALLSYFARANYNFDERWLVTATLRRDGSSRFGANNRYGLFPSAAVAWRISNEERVKNIDWLYNLKLRAGVGAVGNQEIGLYSYTANLRGVNVVIADQLGTGFAPDNIANPDVKWEASVQTNVGVDLGLWENRVEIIADAYLRRAEDMLLPQLIPATAGWLNPPFVNIGSIENRGVELTINTQNTTGKFDWSTGFNFSVNRNEVLDLGSTGALTGVVQRIPVTRTEVGQPVGMLYGWVTDGIFQSLAEVTEAPFQSDGTRAGDIRFKDLNNDGIIDGEDQTFIGDPNPDFTANLNNTIRYKGFDVNIFLQGVYGNEIMNLLRRNLESMVNNSNQLKIVADRYRTGMPSTTLPRSVFNDPNDNRRISDRWVEDGSFLRLRNVTFGYNLPKPVLEKFRLQNLRVYLSGQNLITWTKYSGYDPEIGSFNQNPLVNGVENGRYPIARSFTFGVNAGF